MHTSQTTFEYHDLEVHITGISDDHIFKAISESSFFYEPTMLKKIEKLKGLRTVLDIGANIGNHSLFFALYTDSDSVISVEPYKKAREILFQNIKNNNLNKSITVIKEAVDDHTGQVKLQPFSTKNIGKTKTIQGTGTPSITIDQLSEGMDIGLIKIDIEGNELRALRGATYVLATQKPHLFIEASTKNRYEQISAYLKQFGYECKGKYNWTPTYHFKYCALVR